MRTKFKNVANLLFIVLFASCNREGVVENDELSDNGKIAVATEITVDGVELTTRAASEAGYTTGDGLYDKGDDVVVAAFSNDGYELAAFYDKKYPSTNLGASHNLTVEIPQIFKAEFRKKSFTITVNASPTDGGTVTGGGSYNKGSSCTVTATPKSGYTFDGWYEGSTKVSSNSSYSFTVSSNRTMTARFGNGEKVFYFFPNYYLSEWIDEAIGGRFHLIKPDGTRTYLDIDYPNEEPGELTLKADGSGMYSAMLYQPGNQGSEPYGWGVYDQDGNSLGTIESDCLNLNKSLYDKYPSGTLFRPGEYYVGSGASGAYLITIKAAGWRNNSWSLYVDQKCKVGINGDLSSGDYTFTAVAGSTVTVKAEGWNITGDIGDGQYVNGFYTKDHTLLKQSPKPGGMPSWADTYTFTVTGDKEIYVDFQNY